MKQILCVVDSRGDAKPALKRAASLAENNQARMKVLVVVENTSVAPETLSGGPTAEEFMIAAVETWTQDLDTLIKPYRSRTAIENKISVGVVFFLETIHDLLRHAPDRVIKTAEPQAILGQIDCSVFAIKPPGLGTPVTLGG